MEIAELLTFPTLAWLTAYCFVLCIDSPKKIQNPRQTHVMKFVEVILKYKADKQTVFQFGSFTNKKKTYMQKKTSIWTCLE